MPLYCLLKRICGTWESGAVFVPSAQALSCPVAFDSALQPNAFITTFAGTAFPFQALSLSSLAASLCHPRLPHLLTTFSDLSPNHLMKLSFPPPACPQLEHAAQGSGCITALEVFKKHAGVTLKTWFRGGVGSAGLMLGFDDLRGLFQSKLFCDSLK